MPDACPWLLAGLVSAVTGAILAMLILIGSRIFDLESRFVSPGRIAGVVDGYNNRGHGGRVRADGTRPYQHRSRRGDGCVITTSNDVLGVLVFFILATQFYFD